MSKLFYPTLTKDEISGDKKIEENNGTHDEEKEKEKRKNKSIQRNEKSEERRKAIVDTLTLLGQDEKIIGSIAKKFATLIYDNINTHLSHELESREKIMKYRKKTIEFREQIIEYTEKATKSREQIINGLETYITTYIKQYIENNNTPKQLVIDYFSDKEFIQIFADAGIDNINSLCKHLQIMIGFIGQKIQYNSKNQFTEFDIVNKKSKTEVLEDTL